MATVSSVTNHFITAKEGFTTTTSGSVASGASTVGLNSVTGYSDGDVITLVIDPSDTDKKQVFTGTVDASGVQITDVIWTEGTNQTHLAGATVVDYETATAWAMLQKGLLVSHNQDGTHDFDGAWTSWTPIWTDFNTSLATLNFAKFTQIGKTVCFKLKYTLTGAAVLGSARFSVPVSMNSTGMAVDADPIQSSVHFKDASGGTAWGSLMYIDANTVLVRVLTPGTTVIYNTALSSTNPITWASGDIISITGTYEAA